MILNEIVADYYSFEIVENYIIQYYNVINLLKSLKLV